MPQIFYTSKMRNYDAAKNKCFTVYYKHISRIYVFSANNAATNSMDRDSKMQRSLYGETGGLTV